MKIAWIFPGQGSQEVSMGKAVFETSPAARAVFERADRALGRPLTKLCFEGPLEDLTRTENTQPALVATSSALLAALLEKFPALKPAFAAGHSLGEYSALVAAGALSLEDALRTVELRGRAMQSAVPQGKGSMLAVIGGERDAVLALCAEARSAGVIEPANFNAPGQIVLSGETAAIERAAALAGDRKLRAVPLNVSAPFHSSLMVPAARAVEAALVDVPVGPLAFPVFANVTAEENHDSGKVRELLVRQISSAVLWEQSVSKMAEAGVTHALEIGPGRVLAGLVRRIDKRIQVLSVSDPETIQKLGPLLG